MTKEMVVRKNLELLEEFMKYAVEHPEILNHIPKDAQLIILPENDQELLEMNKQTVEECKKSDRQFVVFRMKMPEKPVPQLEEIS
ncbi:MAG: hypothetical protein HY707_03680 [Ignavibacteriae bacterium]|nr:hypothetical protein [Ignavibacteriota bacterium]